MWLNEYLCVCVLPFTKWNWRINCVKSIKYDALHVLKNCTMKSNEIEIEMKTAHTHADRNRMKHLLLTTVKCCYFKFCHAYRSIERCDERATTTTTTAKCRTKKQSEKKPTTSTNIKNKTWKEKKGNFKIVKFKSSKNIEVTAKQLSWGRHRHRIAAKPFPQRWESISPHYRTINIGIITT